MFPGTIKHGMEASVTILKTIKTKYDDERNACFLKKNKKNPPLRMIVQFDPDFANERSPEDKP